MSCSPDTNLKPSRAKKTYRKSQAKSSKKDKTCKTNKKSKQYIPKRPLEISKNIKKLNDATFLTKNGALINKTILLFEGKFWNQVVNKHSNTNSKSLSITIRGCHSRMSQQRKVHDTKDNEFKSMLLKSDNNYMRIMSDIFDPYLNGIESILHIILLYKGRHLLPIRCHIDLLPYFHKKIRNYKPRQKLWNKAIKNTQTGIVTIDWIPDKNIFIIEDIYDEWIAHIRNTLLLRNNVNEEAIFYIPDGDIFMAVHSNNHKNNTLRQKNIFTRLYIKSLINFDEYAEYSFCMDLAGINYNYLEILKHTYYREPSWSYQSRSRCWNGDGLVVLSDGTKKLIKDLCINDKVAVLEKLPNDVVTGYKTATVIVKIESVVNRKYDMVYVDNKLWITPYHAVLINDDDDGLKWKLPCNLNKIKQKFVTSIYNFILDGGHVLNVNGIWANTLGHDLIGDVIEHPFWGNSKAMNQYWSQKKGYPNIVEYI